MCVIEFAQVHGDWQARAMKVFRNFGISLLLPHRIKIRKTLLYCSIFETRFPTRTIVYGIATCNFSSLLNSVVKYINIMSAPIVEGNFTEDIEGNFTDDVEGKFAKNIEENFAEMEFWNYWWSSIAVRRSGKC